MTAGAEAVDDALNDDIAHGDEALLQNAGNGHDGDFFSAGARRKACGFSTVSMVRNRRNTTITASTQLTPWHRKVAQATPATPILKAVTKRMSTAMLDRDEAARK